MKKRIPLLFILLLSHFAQLSSQSNASPPNIVFIFADDLGYGDIGSYGASDIDTPAIDSLGTDGIRFTDFYAASPICSPSRAALLTGRYPIRQGIKGVFFPQSFDGISPEETTIAELLKTKGYRTGIVGKWHLGHHYKHLPLQNGFDSYFGIPYSNDMEMAVYLRGNDVENYDVDQTYTTRTYTEEAIKFIEANKERPFYLYLAHSMPHVPIYASEPFRGSSNRGIYGDVIQELDWSVQKILDTLEKHDLDDNTLVVFTSDNGPWTVMEHLGGSSGGLRESKMFTFDGGQRVPCLARWPASIPSGQESRAMANMMDWFPTIARIANIDTPTDKPIDGRDILPVLTGTGKRDGQEFFFFHGNLDLEAYRDGDWKLKLPAKEYKGSRGKQASPAHPLSLFNIANDPGETINLAKHYPERTQTMQTRMAEFLKSLGPLPAPKVNRRKVDESHFEILGKN